MKKTYHKSVYSCSIQVFNMDKIQKGYIEL